MFSKVVDGQENDISLDIEQLGDRQLSGFSQKPEIWYLQLQRVGSKYTGRIRTNWIP